MTVLVIGRGAEDVEHPLGMAVMRGYLHPAGLIGLDIEAARSSCRPGGVEAVLNWYLEEESPQRVVLVGEHGVSAPTVEALTSALGDRVEHLDAGAATVAHLDALVASSPRPTVRERAPRVTLGIPVYNQERYLHATLRGALDQTYDDFEVLVIDDGSTDASGKILESYAGDPRLRVIKQTNLGQTGRMDLVLNRLIRHSRGELLATVGGDDVCHPDRLRSQVDAFDEDPHLDICHGAMICIDAEGHPTGNGYVLPRAYDEASMLRLSVMTNPVNGPTVMIRRSAHESIALYADGIAGDHELWTKASGRLRFRYLPQHLVEYRLHDKALSTTPEGIAHCASEAHRGIRNVILKRSLEDFYPELKALDSHRAWYAAGLSLGSRFTTRDPQLSLHFFQLALEHHDGAEVHHNMALAHLALDQVAPATVQASRAAALDARSSGLHRFLSGGPNVPLRLVTRESEVLAAVEAGRESLVSRSWDGTSSRISSLFAAVDLDDRGAMAAAATAWSRSTRPEDLLRWVVPTLGRDPMVVLDRLMDAAGTSLAGAAEVVIEKVDELCLLPRDLLVPPPVSDPAHAHRITDWVQEARERARTGTRPVPALA